MTPLRRWKESPTERSAGAKEKQYLLFVGFIHGGSPSPPILFMSRGATYVPPLTYQVWYWLELLWPCSARVVEPTPKTCSFQGAGLSPQKVRTWYEDTQPEKCGFLG